MIEIKQYTTVRLKLLEGCQLNCRFCHHEGNPFAKSVDMQEVTRLLPKLAGRLGLNKVHLTGGEPTLYRELPRLIEKLSSIGLKIAITTHGLFSEDVFACLHRFLDSGVLDHINFSIHTLDPKRYMELNGIQENQRSYESARKSLETILTHAISLSKTGKVNVNCVPGESIASLSEIFDFTKHNGIPLRLVPDWTILAQADRSIQDFISSRKGTLSKFVVVHPTSNYSAVYSVEGTELAVKLIRPVGLQSMCARCSMKKACIEFLGNLRLEGNPLQARLCIHQDKAPYVQSLDDFLSSPQIDEFKQKLASSPLTSDYMVFGEDNITPHQFKVSHQMRAPVTARL